MNELIQQNFGIYKIKVEDEDNEHLPEYMNNRSDSDSFAGWVRKRKILRDELNE